MKINKIVILFITVISLLCVSCFGKKTDSSSVTDMTEEEIVKNNTYSKSSSITKTINNKTTINIKRFSGVEKIMTLQPKGKLMEINISSTVESGELRIVVCDSKNIIYEFEINEKDQKFVLPSDNNKYYLKTVGKNARYKLEFSYDIKESVLPSFGGTIL